MIETITALVLFMTTVQAQYTNPDFAWPLGRSYTLTVKSTLTDAQLQAAKAPCCDYLVVDGKIFRVGTLVYLVKVR